MEFETWHIVVALIIIALLFVCKKSEGYRNFCGNCQDLTEDECKDCENCGVCVTDSGCRKCAQGDEAGPYFRDDCVDWEYKGKTKNNKCRNYDMKSVNNCGYFYPYNKRSILHQKYAAIPHQLGTLSAVTRSEDVGNILDSRTQYLR
jgi:hypothetical protein